MSAKINTRHPTWVRFEGLRTFHDFAYLVSECNKGSEGRHGEWFFAPAERLPGNIAVIFSGSWDEGRPRDAPASTYAELFHMDDEEDAVEYTPRLQHWQSQPESDDQPGRCPPRLVPSSAPAAPPFFAVPQPNTGQPGEPTPIPVAEGGRMLDPTEKARRQRLKEINSQPMCREGLEAKYGQVWTTAELARDFVVIGFMAPLIAVRRKSDGVTGSLEFQHQPRYYFDFKPDE